MKLLQNKIFECNKCPRLQKSYDYPIPYVCFNDNISDIEIMCIGRNPGNNPERIRTSDMSLYKLFEIDRTSWINSKFGKYMIGNLSLHNINKILFTNIIKCSSPNNSNILKSEIENCSCYLEEQIKLIKPKLILTFGSEALKYFGNYNLKDCFLKEIKINDFIVIPLYHPSFIGRFKVNSDLNKQQTKFLTNLKV